MPIRLCWNPGTMCPYRTVRVVSLRLEEAVDI